ncbi:MAG: nucleoside monophosphate kinase, partial [Deltaproteobacteria bacterium]|nr:nucleoside monophosphate kinase [Deltaproteobacteria bacterium]
SEQLKKFASQISNDQALIINLVVPEQVLIDRMLRRATIEGRTDDTPESIKERLKTYENSTAPVLNGFKNLGYKVVDLNGNKSIEEIWLELQNILKNFIDIQIH